MKLSEEIQMTNNTKCDKVENVIMLGANYTKEQLKEKMGSIELKREIKDRLREFAPYDFKAVIINSAWNFCHACEDLINCRIDVEKKIFEEGIKDQSKFIKGKSKSFEKALALDVMKKYGDDPERNTLLESKALYEKYNKNYADAIIIPELKKDPNAELKDLASVKDYIYKKVVAHYKGEFDYPVEAEASVDSVVTIGV